MGEHDEAPCFPMEFYGAISHERFNPSDAVVITADRVIRTLSSLVNRPTIMNFFTTW